MIRMVARRAVPRFSLVAAIGRAVKLCIWLPCLQPSVRIGRTLRLITGPCGRPSESAVRTTRPDFQHTEEERPIADLPLETAQFGKFGVNP